MILISKENTGFEEKYVTVYVDFEVRGNKFDLHARYCL
jgi:hypothetical protein